MNLTRYKDFGFDYVRQLAAQNGYTYTEREKSDGCQSIYDNQYTNTTQLQKLSFVVDGLPCEYFTASYTPLAAAKQAPALLQSGEMGTATASLFQLQVFAVTLPFEVEDLYVESRTNVTLNNILGLSSVVFHDTKQVALEGDFNSFFRVYVPNDEELNAFTILAPNVMLAMLERAGNYDFEFSGNKIFFYKTFSYFNGTYINLSKNDYDELLSFGIESARSMARAGRPAQVIENSNKKMWELFGTKSSLSYLTLFLITMIGAFFVMISFFFPPLWPVAIVALVVFLVKREGLKRKRRSLVERYAGR